MDHPGPNDADAADQPAESLDDVPGPARTFGRRTALALGGAAVAGLSAATPSQAVLRSGAAGSGPVGRPQLVDSLRPDIAPRDAWGADLAATGPIAVEDDVRFLLVHHTASTNDYGPDDVVGQIRDFYDFHTGPEKGWPDVAYNFFVDRFGRIWEARAGSIEGPVRGDATGGSQGFALLCSLIGDHSKVEVSPEALDGLTRLLAWLAERHRLDTSAGATVDFVSRGSNRWPAGTTVTAATISGHRDMSQTTCPGDFAYGLLAETIPATVTAIRERAAAATPSTSGPEVSIVTSSSTTSIRSTSSSGSSVENPDSEAAAGDQSGGDGDDSARTGLVVLGALATVIAVASAGVARFRRRPS